MDSLYELTGQYLMLQQMIDGEVEADPQVIADTMESLNAEIEVKAENYGRMIQNYESEAKAYDAEIQRLTDRKTAAENKAKRLKDNLYNSMIAMDTPKIKTDLFKFTIAKNGGLKPLTLDKDLSEMPEEFITVKRSVNTTAIRNYIKEHGSCEYGHLEEAGTHLLMK